MKMLQKIGLVAGLIFSLTAQAASGGLSRELTDEEFQVLIPGKIDSYDRSVVVSDAFAELTDRLTASQYPNISIDKSAVDSYVVSVDSTDKGILVQFDKDGVLKFFQDRQLAVYVQTPPDVLMWISWQDLDSSYKVLSDSDSNGFISALKEASGLHHQAVFFPMMDSDDTVTVDNIAKFDLETLSAASTRYGTRYVVVGNMSGSSMHWELYEVEKMFSPVYQSNLTGEPSDMGKMMEHDLIYYFAQGHTEKVKGLRGAAAPASNRVGLIGAAVGKNKVYVVIAGRMSYREMMDFERSLKTVPGLTNFSLYQTQADQNVYEIMYNGNYPALSAGICKIKGIKQIDTTKPYNFAFDVAFIQEPVVADVETTEGNSQLKEVSGTDQKPTATSSSDAKPTESQSNEKPAGAEQGTVADGKDNKDGQDNKEAGAEKPKDQSDPLLPAAPEKMQAIPITDPDSIIDTSNERL